MPKKPPTAEQLAYRAKWLRVMGYTVDENNAARIGKLWGDRAYYYATNPELHRFEFIRFGSNAEKNLALKRTTSREQQFPAGVWVQRPYGVPLGEWEYRPNKNGTVSIIVYE